MRVSRIVLLSSVVSLVAFAQADVQVTGKKGTVGVKTGAGGVEVTGKDGKKVNIGTGAGVQIQSGDKKVEVGSTDAGVKVESGSKKVETSGSSVKVQSAGKGGTVQVTGAGPQDAVTAAGVFEINGMGKTVNHVCAANEDVDVNGSGHTVVLTGPCRKVDVNGQGNTVSVDVVGTLEVNGMSNKATWKSALSGSKPKVSVAGVDNSATQAR